MISLPKKPQLRALAKAVTLSCLPVSKTPSPACQQQVVGSAEALCGATLAKCTGLIAFLNMHPPPLYKRELFMIEPLPPPLQ